MRPTSRSAAASSTTLWPPGHRALEQEVALALGMSRTPVREALMRLQNEGLVEVIPRHGMRVLPVSPNDMREIYQILTALECMAAELLAQRKPSDKELEPLVAATKAMDKALKAEDLDAWAAADERFHAHLVELAGNRAAAGHGAELLGPRAPRTHVHVAPAAQAGELHQGTHADGRAAARRRCRRARPRVTRAHRERANRELVTIFEHFKLAQM